MPALIFVRDARSCSMTYTAASQLSAAGRISAKRALSGAMSKTQSASSRREAIAPRRFSPTASTSRGESPRLHAA